MPWPHQVGQAIIHVPYIIGPPLSHDLPYEVGETRKLKKAFRAGSNSSPRFLGTEWVLTHICMKTVMEEKRP